MDASGGLGLPPIELRAGDGSTGRPVPWAADPEGTPSDPSLVGLPAAEIAARVRAGEITAVDVVRAHLDHIEAVDARVGAFRVVRREAALSRTRVAISVAVRPTIGPPSRAPSPAPPWAVPTPPLASIPGP